MMKKKEQVVNELHKSARKNFRRRRVIMKGIDDLWQIDLVEMGMFEKENNGFRFLLTVIDTFSKYAWALPIRNKSSIEVEKAMETILKEGRIPKNIQSDDGKEFFNKNFQKLMQKHNINHYSTYSPLKASIVERFNRTLKSKMWKKFSMNGNYRWLGMIGTLIDDYNNTWHRTINMKPSQVSALNEKRLLATVYSHIKIVDKGKFNVDDPVRISKYKHLFEKGYTPNWTTEIFKIYKVQNTNPVTYLLKDYKDQPIKGSFYALELSKVKYPDVYLVEKTLRRRGNKVFVKWLGFDSTHNSWIDKADVQ